MQAEVRKMYDLRCANGQISNVTRIQTLFL
jgi:hypothetical protein